MSWGFSQAKPTPRNGPVKSSPSAEQAANSHPPRPHRSRNRPPPLDKNPAQNTPQSPTGHRIVLQIQMRLVASGLLAQHIGVRQVFGVCAGMLVVLIAIGKLFMEPKDQVAG